jgi:nitrate/nitrite transporter NarK
MRASRFSWGIALSSGAIAVGLSAFLETLARNFVGQADAAAAVPDASAFAVSGAAIAIANLVGGFLAARRSRNRPLMHALVAGAVCDLFFIVMLFRPDAAPNPAWYVGLMLVIPMAAAVCGARLVRPREPH